MLHLGGKGKCHLVVTIDGVSSEAGVSRLLGQIDQGKFVGSAALIGGLHSLAGILDLIDMEAHGHDRIGQFIDPDRPLVYKQRRSGAGHIFLRGEFGLAGFLVKLALHIDEVVIAQAAVAGVGDGNGVLARVIALLHIGAELRRGIPGQLFQLLAFPVVGKARDIVDPAGLVYISDHLGIIEVTQLGVLLSIVDLLAYRRHLQRCLFHVELEDIGMNVHREADILAVHGVLHRASDGAVLRYGQPLRQQGLNTLQLSVRAGPHVAAVASLQSGLGPFTVDEGTLFVEIVLYLDHRERGLIRQGDIPPGAEGQGIVIGQLVGQVDRGVKDALVRGIPGVPAVTRAHEEALHAQGQVNALFVLLFQVSPLQLKGNADQISFVIGGELTQRRAVVSVKHDSHLADLAPFRLTIDDRLRRVGKISA